MRPEHVVRRLGRVLDDARQIDRAPDVDVHLRPAQYHRRRLCTDRTKTESPGNLPLTFAERGLVTSGARSAPRRHDDARYSIRCGRRKQGRRTERGSHYFRRKKRALTDDAEVNVSRYLGAHADLALVAARVPVLHVAADTITSVSALHVKTVRGSLA